MNRSISKYQRSSNNQTVQTSYLDLGKDVGWASAKHYPENGQGAKGSAGREIWNQVEGEEDACGESCLRRKLTTEETG